MFLLPASEHFAPLRSFQIRPLTFYMAIAAFGIAPGLANLPTAFISAAQAETVTNGGEHVGTEHVGTLWLEHPWARETSPNAQVGGAFLKITNKGESPDRLVSVVTPIAERAEIHVTKTEDGVVSMRALPEGIALPPGDTVELKPGSLHLMLTGLHEPLKAGDHFKATLTFEKAGTAEITFLVEALGGKAAPPAEHHHDH